MKDEDAVDILSEFSDQPQVKEITRGGWGSLREFSENCEVPPKISPKSIDRLTRRLKSLFECLRAAPGGCVSQEFIGELEKYAVASVASVVVPRAERSEARMLRAAEANMALIRRDFAEVAASEYSGSGKADEKRRFGDDPSDYEGGGPAPRGRSLIREFRQSTADEVARYTADMVQPVPPLCQSRVQGSDAEKKSPGEGFSQGGAARGILGARLSEKCSESGFTIRGYAGGPFGNLGVESTDPFFLGQRVEVQCDNIKYVGFVRQINVPAKTIQLYDSAVGGEPLNLRFFRRAFVQISMPPAESNAPVDIDRLKALRDLLTEVFREDPKIRDIPLYWVVVEMLETMVRLEDRRRNNRAVVSRLASELQANYRLVRAARGNTDGSRLVADAFERMAEAIANFYKGAL